MGVTAVGPRLFGDFGEDRGFSGEQPDKSMLGVERLDMVLLNMYHEVWS
jgi:hypothetical protein